MADWQKILSRGDVEDRRGMAPLAGGISVGGVVLLVAVNYFLGGDLSAVLPHLEQLAVQQLQTPTDSQQFSGEDSYEMFASAVLGSANDLWSAEFQEQGKVYDPPTLVLFRQATQSACGGAYSQIGPHYCPLDETIYLDETFFDELTSRFGARGGDVAEAYVIGHEVGHHVQQELGVMDQVRSIQSRNPQRENELSVQVELQADCFAGLWANSIREAGVFESEEEIREAMDAAAAVGDDRIQEKSTGRVNPESWTHGSSDQRVEAFNRGYNSGNFAACEINY